MEIGTVICYKKYLLVKQFHYLMQIIIAFQMQKLCLSLDYWLHEATMGSKFQNLQSNCS